MRGRRASSKNAEQFRLDLAAEKLSHNWDSNFPCLLTPMLHSFARMGKEGTT